MEVCEIGSVSGCTAAFLSEEDVSGVQEGAHLQCLSLAGRRRLQVRRAQAGHGGATAITQHQITSMRWLQTSSSDSLPVAWRAGPSHRRVCHTQPGLAHAWWDMLGLAGESGMVAPVTAVPVISCALI